MPVDAIGRVASNVSGLEQNSVGVEDFLQVFLTQLNFQDPLEPVDNREFIAQLAQFSTLEIQNRSNASLEGMLDVVSITQSLGLLNRTVEVRSSQGIAIGEVTSVRFDAGSGSPLLTIQTENNEFIQDVSPSSVSLIR